MRNFFLKKFSQSCKIFVLLLTNHRPKVTGSLPPNQSLQNRFAPPQLYICTYIKGQVLLTCEAVKGSPPGHRHAEQVTPTQPDQHFYL